MPVPRLRSAFLPVAFLFLSFSVANRTLSAQMVSPEGAAGFAGQADQGVEPADTTLRAARGAWRQLFDSSNWAELDAVANQLRSQRLRFLGGAWQLSAFYNTVGPAGPQTATDAAWEAQIARLQAWGREEPASVTPRIALARAYIAFAWKARGNGFANTVTSEGWQQFSERIALARTTLEQAQKLNNGDPEWFRAMQTVALAQGWPRQQVDALVEAALSNEPGYYPSVAAEANYLLPKWYGKPGETEEFAARVADRIGGPDGDAAYFMIASGINCCRRTQAPAMVWARVKQGYLALEQLYGTNHWEKHAFAFLALRAGDTETAQAAFAKIGNDWDANVWGGKPRFDASRLGHPLGQAQPVQPDNAPPVESTN
ncbi:MAG: hypothetical protein ACLPZY_18875 [Terracidiphilus sp.]